MANRIPLDGDRAREFRQAFDRRDDYIRAELIGRYADGPERVPLPGCPECSVPAEEVRWAVHDEPDVIEVDIATCGHRFTVQRPVVETITDESGRMVAQHEWMP